MSRKIAFEASTFEDSTEWAKSDKKIHRKMVKFIRDIDRSPFPGLGKPESLKYKLSDFWSRRINNEHRLVYKATDAEVVILSCRYHYS